MAFDLQVKAIKLHSAGKSMKRNDMELNIQSDVLKKSVIGKFLFVILTSVCLSFLLNAQNSMTENQTLSPKQKSIIRIAANTARGNLDRLKSELNAGLEAGLTINEIKEVIVHLYAYCGFPRSIRGLQTFMEVLDERKAKGITDKTGAEASLIKQETDKYERGKKILGELTATPQEKPKSGYGAFAPVIDNFLKEHLFADLFERDVLTYAERELTAISVLSAIGGVEPMLRSHLEICLNVGLTPGQLTEFTDVMQQITGRKEAKRIRIVLNDVLNSRKDTY